MEKNKIVLITGATEGIGKATATGLAKLGFQVIIHGRNEQKAKNTTEEIIKSTGNNKVEYIIADLSSLEDVKALSEKFSLKYPHLDVLINNAGIMLQERKLSKDGYEMNFAVNYLSHYLLTILFLDKLKAAPEGRIINLTSSLYNGGKPDFDDLQQEKNYSLMVTYNTSKLFNLYFTIELAERLKSTNVSAFALHPGVVNTRLARDFKGVLKVIFSILTKFFFVSPEKGAATSIYLATQEGLKSKSGSYFENKKRAEIKGLGNDITNRKKLWEMSYQMLKNYIPNIF